jgi:hypothetical protein
MDWVGGSAFETPLKVATHHARGKLLLIAAKESKVAGGQSNIGFHSLKAEIWE